MMKRNFRAAVPPACAVVVCLSFGCVKEDPLVVGKRDASVDAPSTPALVVPLADPPDEDPADCRHCSETLNTDSARGTLCRKNGDPSSVRRLNAVVDCVCYDKCVQPCGTYCAGSTQTADCSACIFAECGDQLSACIADRRQ